MKPCRVIILFHENADRAAVGSYLIVHLASYWIKAGHEVIVLFGTENRMAADVLILHVDLSVIPDTYLRFAERYPVVINGGVRDIRKSAISRNLVGPADGYTGPVIVKSDYNYAAIPEQAAGCDSAVFETLPFKDPSEYRVYERYADVPESIAVAPGIVIERFLPEREGELYCTRFYQFFGSREICYRMLSPSPIVNSSSYVDTQEIEPHPGIVAHRRRLGMDYGKLDYVINDGQVHLLDVNKTIGFIPTKDDENLERLREYRAQGLYDFLPC